MAAVTAEADQADDQGAAPGGVRLQRVVDLVGGVVGVPAHSSDSACRTRPNRPPE